MKLEELNQRLQKGFLVKMLFNNLKYDGRKLVSKSGCRDNGSEIETFGKGLDFSGDVTIDISPISVITGPDLVLNPIYFGRKS